MSTAAPSSSNGNVNTDARCQSIPDYMYDVGNGTVDNVTLQNYFTEIQQIANSSLIPVAQEYFDLQVSLLVIGIWHLFISTIIYTYMYFAKSKDPSTILFIRIKKRSLVLYFLNSFITAAFLVTSQVTEIIWTPCWITNLLNSFLSPLIGIYVMAKTVDFFNRSSFHRLIKEANVADSSSDSSNDKPKRHLVGDMKLIFYRQPSTNTIQTDNKQGEDDDNESEIEPNPNAKPVSKETLRFLKLMLSPKVRHALLFVVFAPYAFFVIAEFALLEFLHPAANCYGCDGFYGYFFIAIIYAALTVIFGLVIAYKSRDYPDNFGMMRENVYYSVSGALAISSITALSFSALDTAGITALVVLYWVGYQMMHFVSSTLQIIFAIQEEDQPNIFQDLQMILGRVDPRWRRRRRARKGDDTRPTNASPVTELSTSFVANPKAKLSDEMRNLLENKYGSLEYTKFEQYLAGEFATENIKMYVECFNWKKQFFDLNANTARSRAKRIVNLYVKTDSVFYVNLPASMREKLEDLVGNTGKDLEQDLFDDAQKEMFNILEGAFMRYKRKAKANRSST